MNFIILVEEDVISAEFIRPSSPPLSGIEAGTFPWLKDCGLVLTLQLIPADLEDLFGGKSYYSSLGIVA